MSNALVLLVGTNPLPNLIAWQELQGLLTDPEHDTLILLCSDERPDEVGTKAIAERLAKEIQAGGYRQQPEYVLLRNPADSFEIAAATRKVLTRLDPATNKPAKRFDRVHLNHTGGTKPMAVFAYDAAKDAITATVGEKGFESSYLDARWHQLHIRRPGATADEVTEDLRRKYQIDFDQLFRLHGASPEDDGAADPLWPRTAIQVQRAGMKDLWVLCHDWIDKYFSQRGQKKRAAKIDKQIPWPAAFPDIGRSFADETGWDVAASLDFGEIPERQWQAVIDFFHGTWLESVMLAAVQKAIKAAGASYPSRMGVKRRMPGAARPMELDVVVLRGYQLVLFSCSRSQVNDTLKKKGFEAGHRALQLGGEEARAYLITLVPDVATANRPDWDPPAHARDLREDLSTDIGGALRVSVIGKNGNGGLNMNDPVRVACRALEL